MGRNRSTERVSVVLKLSAYRSLDAIQDLAADCLNCSQLIVRLQNPLGEIRILPTGVGLTTVSLLQALIPLGFQLLHPSTHPQIAGTLIGMIL